MRASRSRSSIPRSAGKRRPQPRRPLPARAAVDDPKTGEIVKEAGDYISSDRELDDVRKRGIERSRSAPS